MATPWGQIKAAFLKGKSYRELSEKYGVSIKTIQNRASNEGWKKEKGKIEEEAGQILHERAVRARVNRLEKLAEANEDLIEGLLRLAAQIKINPFLLQDEKMGLKNAESMANAISVATRTQRDLWKLPDMDQGLARKKENQRKKEAKEKIDMERERLDWEKSKATGESDVKEVWVLHGPEGIGAADE